MDQLFESCLSLEPSILPVHICAQGDTQRRRCPAMTSVNSSHFCKVIFHSTFSIGETRIVSTTFSIRNPRIEASDYCLYKNTHVDR